MGCSCGRVGLVTGEGLPSREMLWALPRTRRLRTSPGPHDPTLSIPLFMGPEATGQFVGLKAGLWAPRWARPSSTLCPGLWVWVWVSELEMGGEGRKDSHPAAVIYCAPAVCTWDFAKC